MSTLRVGVMLALLVTIGLLTLLWWQWSLPQPSADPRWDNAPCWFSEVPGQRADCAWFRPSIQGDQPAALPVVRLRTGILRPSRTATVYLSGGPGGGSYLQEDDIPFWRDWMQRLQLDQDLVLYDQRGTGLAVPELGCPAADALLLSLLAERIDTEAQWQRMEPVLMECVRQVSDADRASGLYSTATAAADLRELLGLLQQQWGYQEIVVYGVSYGARLAVEALSEPVDGVSRVVLDSLYPAGSDLYLDFPDQFAELLDEFDRQCRQTTDCDLPKDGLRGLLRQALQRVERDPLAFELIDPQSGAEQPLWLDAEILLSAVEHALYADLDTAALPERLREVIAAAPGDAWHELLTHWLWTNLDDQFSLVTHVLMECRDNPRVRAEQELAVLARHPDWRKALQRPASQFDYCDLIGVPADPLLARVLALPTLLLAARLDPRTPAATALDAVRDFPRAHALVLPVAGHSVVDFDDCAARVAGRFLNRGEFPDAHECLSAAAADGAEAKIDGQ